MSMSPTEFLRHILDEANYLISASAGLSKEQYLADETIRRAFIRSIEVIGEAAMHIPDDWRSRHPHIEWRRIAGVSSTATSRWTMRLFGMSSRRRCRN